MKRALAVRILPVGIGLGVGAAIWGPSSATLALLAFNLATIAFINPWRHN